MALSAETRKRLEEIFGVTPKAPETQVTWGVPEVDLSQVSAFEKKTAGPTTQTMAKEPAKIIPEPKYKEPEIQWGVVVPQPEITIDARTAQTTPMETDITMLDVAKDVGTFGGVLAQEFVKDWAAAGQKIASLPSPLGPLWGADTDMVDPNTFLLPLIGDEETAKKWGNVLFGTDQPFNLTSRDKEFWEGVGLSGTETAGVVTSLFVLADVIPGGQTVGVFEAFVKASRTISKTKKLSTVERTLRSLNISEDVISTYAPRLVNLTDEVEVGRIVKEAIEDSVRGAAGLPPRTRIINEAAKTTDVIETGRIVEGNKVFNIPARKVTPLLSPRTTDNIARVSESLIRAQENLIRAGERLAPVRVVDTPDGGVIVEGIEQFIAAQRLDEGIDIIEVTPSAKSARQIKPTKEVPRREQKPGITPASQKAGSRAAEIARRTETDTGRRGGRIPESAGLDQIIGVLRAHDAEMLQAARAGDITARGKMFGPKTIAKIERFMRDVGEDLFKDVRLSLRTLGFNSSGEFNFVNNLISLSRRMIETGMVPRRTMIHELWHSLSRYLPEQQRRILETEYARQYRGFARRNSWFNFIDKRAFRAENGDLILSRGDKKLFDARYGKAAKFVEVNKNQYSLDWSTKVNGEPIYRFKSLDEFFAEEMTDRFTGARFSPKGQNLIDTIKTMFWDIIDAFETKFGRAPKGAVPDRLYEDFIERKYIDLQRDRPLAEGPMRVEGPPGEPEVPRARQMKTSREIPSLEKAAEQAGAFPEQQRPFTVPKQEKKKRTLTQRALSKTRSADEIAKILRKGGMSPEDIKNYELPDGSKLSEVAEVHVAKNGATSAIIYKSDIDSIKKSFVQKPSTGKLPTWTERMKTKTGRAANVYEVNQVFFDRKGLKKQFYEPIRNGAERAASEQSEEFLSRFKDAGLFKRKGFFTPDRFKINKKEAKRIGEYFLTRQGKGYDIKFSDLTQKEKQFVKVVDSIIKDTEKDFFLVAKQNGIDPSKIEDYAPIMAKAEYKEAADWGNDLRPLIGPKAEEFGKAKRPQFGSVFERKENVPVSVYETDIRKTFPVWMEGVTRFNNLGQVAPKMYALLNNDEILRLLDTDTVEITAKFLDDTLANGRPDTPAGRIVADALRLVRGAAAVSGLSFAYSSVLKQPLTIIAAMFVDKVRPQFRSKFAKEIGIEVKDLASITERKGNLSIADLQRGWFRIGTGPLTETDRKVAEMLLKGFLDKEYKKTMKALNGRPLSKEMTERILIDAQDKLDLWMGGMTRSQLPWAFRGEAGRIINMFQLPLVSQLNGFIYHILKAQGYKGNIKATTEVMAAAITIAYTEQAITNLALNWDSKEDMVRDVRNSLLGNLPLVSQLTFAITSDSDFQISPLTGNLSTLIHSLNRHMEDPSGKTLSEVGFDTAKMFGFPRSLERMVEGTEVIMEGGVRDKDDELQAPVESTPEQIRAFLRGKYGALAAQDYIENAFGLKENRSWNVPQVEFLQNGDWARRMELVDEIGYDETLDLVAEMGPGSQEDFWRYIFAKENPDADKYELGAYLEEQGLDKDGKASKIQLEAHQRRVREIQGLKTPGSLTDETRKQLEEIFNR